MEERFYKNTRKVLFWFFFLSFLIVIPLVIFSSLGYKFNLNLKHFQRTGVISIRSLPSHAEVYLQDKRLDKLSPCDISELLPARYRIRLEKEGFYPYEVNIEVKPALVSLLDAVLIPKIKDVEKIKPELNVYKFFVMEHLFGKIIIALAKEGIYIFNEDLEEIAKIAPIALSEEELTPIKGIKEGRNNFVFWNLEDIWLIDYGAWGIKKELTLEHLYKAPEPIETVFFGFKDRYLIIQAETKIIALDIKNKNVVFEIYRLNSKDAQVYYDVSSDTLFIKDKLTSSEGFTLFKINVAKKIYEKGQD